MPLTLLNRVISIAYLGRVRRYRRKTVGQETIHGKRTSDVKLDPSSNETVESKLQMKETRAIIERIRRVNSLFEYVDIGFEDETLTQIKPGESLLVRFVTHENQDDAANDSWHPYLREQWWVTGITKDGLLRVELPFSHRYQPQQALSILAPIGKPYRFRKSLRNVLLIAYDTPPSPLTSMISMLLGNRIAVTMVLLGEARRYQTSHLPPEIEVIQGDGNLQWSDMVMTFGWADQIFVAAKQDDELVRFAEVMRMVEEKRNKIPPNYIFGVFQTLLPCGVGACDACTIRIGNTLTPVCTHGPAFDLTTVKLPM